MNIKKTRNKRTPVPIHRLKKAEMIYLFTHKCRHGHNYAEHYACFVNEHPEQQERIGFLDIESSNLDANWGVILSWCIKDSRSDTIYNGVISKKDINDFKPDQTDKRIVRELITCMLTFDRIVGHYSRKFDLPFIRTRAIIMDLEFPNFGSIVNDDTWLMARGKLKLNSNRLDTVESALFGETKKTRFLFKYWIGGSRGDEKSLKYIMAHNKQDVLSLERVYYKLRDFVGKRNCSI